MKSPFLFPFRAAGAMCAGLSWSDAGASAADSPVVALPAVVAASTRVANRNPGGSFATAVSALRYEPGADVEARNLAEGQADVSIRGGTFENTGFRLGGLVLVDPQTGHYLMENPVPPQMLGEPRVLTGSENALAGFGASVGTVSAEWRDVAARGELAAGGGSSIRAARISIRAGCCR